MANQVERLVDVPRLPLRRYWTAHSGAMIIWQARLLNTFTRWIDGNMSPRLHLFLSQTHNMSERMGNLSLDGLIDPRKYLPEHADFYPLVRGQRDAQHDCQLCFMNPALVKAFCEEAAKLVASQPRSVTSYTIGHGDNWNLCECEFCSRPIELPGRAAASS